MHDFSITLATLQWLINCWTNDYKGVSEYLELNCAAVILF